MEMLPPAPVPPNVVVGATIVKRFPGYGEHRGTITEIDLDAGKVVVHWDATDERTTLSLGEAAKRALYAIPPTEEEEDDRSLDGDSTIAYDSGDETVDYEGDGGGARTATSSKFWGVHWDRRDKKWQARYTDADGKRRCVGRFDDEEEAARARDRAVRDAGLEGQHRMNAVDATGALVPRTRGSDRPVVAPDPARAPTAVSSKFWGVSWAKKERRWQARYTDANGKRRHIGHFDTQEQAAHAVNAAIRRAGLEGRRKTNPVVDGQLVPRARKAKGHGRDALRKRRREEATATPAPRARRPRRAVDYAAMEG